MTQPTRPGTPLESPLVRAYLDDLERAMLGSDPVEREFVLSEVRDHIDAAFLDPERPATPTAVREVLDALGPVEQVAATVERSPLPTATPSSTHWGSIAAVVVGALAVGLVAVSFPLAIALGVLALVVGLLGVRGGGPHRGRYKVAAWLGAVSLVLSAIAAMALLGVSSTDVPPGEPVEVVSPGP